MFAGEAVIHGPLWDVCNECTDARKAFWASQPHTITPLPPPFQDIYGANICIGDVFCSKRLSVPVGACQVPGVPTKC